MPGAHVDQDRAGQYVAISTGRGTSFVTRQRTIRGATHLDQTLGSTFACCVADATSPGAGRRFRSPEAQLTLAFQFFTSCALQQPLFLQPVPAREQKSQPLRLALQPDCLALLLSRLAIQCLGDPHGCPGNFTFLRAAFTRAFAAAFSRAACSRAAAFSRAMRIEAGIRISRRSSTWRSSSSSFFHDRRGACARSIEVFFMGTPTQSRSPRATLIRRGAHAKAGNTACTGL